MREDAGKKDFLKNERREINKCSKKQRIKSTIAEKK
jgi:hypothetical protein